VNEGAWTPYRGKDLAGRGDVESVINWESTFNDPDGLKAYAVEKGYSGVALRWGNAFFKKVDHVIREEELNDCADCDIWVYDPSRDDEEAAGESTVEEEAASEETVDEEDAPAGDQCPGVTVAIPTSCSANFDCATIRDIFDYTGVRVLEHNQRRRLHRNTPDVSLNLDIACQAKTWANHLAENFIFQHAPG
jgi:hypothetical protein